jgi:class 3 adenylate cyclase
VDSQGPHVGTEIARRGGVTAWVEGINGNSRLIAFLHRARRVLPGDPDFGDPLSIAGGGGPTAAARLLGDREAASREVTLAGLQVWQALTERVMRRPAYTEATIVFTDLVGFSAWSLKVGDDAALRLLRKVAAAIEPPILERNGHIVKRLGDGLMAVFAAPELAITAVLAAHDAVKDVQVEGHTPRMRCGIHAGRPQRIGSDWLGVDVNIAARVMERATKGGVIVSGPTLDRLPPGKLEEMGVSAKRVRRLLFTRRSSGVPTNLTMYRLTIRPEPPGDPRADDD